MQGFTLIELLVVVLIIGILSSVALPQYQKAVNKARLAEVRTTLKAINDACQVAELENGTPPSSFDELSVSFIDSSGNQATGWRLSTKNFMYQFDNTLDHLHTYGFAWAPNYEYSFNIIDGKLHCWDPRGKGICKAYGFSQSGVGCTSGSSPHLSTDCYVE
ncbi:MAG: type IV pilin protein [Candidatus Avelusimicrobium sp.]|uniref:type IV pilin protein n=1 Tax=Candidatus Avelusimicrobium sp. TaxID=3048833 RepID=UPI003F0FE2EA